MQRFVLGKKNQIALISGILIALGFFSHFVLENTTLFNWSFIIASILGAAPIAIQAYQALKVKVISIDVLVTIAVIGAFLIQNYEESAIVTFLFLFGAYLEQRTLNKTRSAIKELTEMAPESAWKQMQNGEFEEIDVDDVDEGDILLVKTGAKIPVDGTVLTGEGHINEASITGESVPVNKVIDSGVFAGTILENGENKEEVLGYLASVERESDHPLAKAVLKDIGETVFSTVKETEVVNGGGIVAVVNGHKVAVGNVTLMEKENIALGQKAKADVKRFEKSGNSLVLTAVDGELKVLMGIRDQIRPGVKKDLQRLKNLGVKNLVVLSGDNQGTVDLVARELGLTEAHGHMLPEDKSAYIKKVQTEGRIVAFVGDGVNDSPSLALADIGIAMGSGTVVAIETSDVVLMNSDFSRLPHALGLTKATARNMKQNIIIAVGVVLVLLASVFFSEWMNMSIGMLVHEASILVVIMNGMRLLRYRLRGD